MFFSLNRISGRAPKCSNGELISNFENNVPRRRESSEKVIVEGLLMLFLGVKSAKDCGRRTNQDQYDACCVPFRWFLNVGSAFVLRSKVPFVY